MAQDVADAKTPFDWSVIFRVLLCLFLGGGFVLFVRNNRLLEHGFRVLANPVRRRRKAPQSWSCWRSWR